MFDGEQPGIYCVDACVCVCLSVQAGVPHLLRSVLHTVTLGCVCPGTEHRAPG